MIELWKIPLIKACVLSIISALFIWIFFNFLLFWCENGGGMEMCIDANSFGVISLVLGMLFMLLWFVSLFFIVKYLSNSKILSIIILLFVVAFVGMGYDFKMTWYKILVILVILSIVSGIKIYKEKKEE